jgi:2-polyprenyl-3-methyl-5-hydroxy-6-metoxy-1,4-benzoquinol methylase
MNEYQYRDTIGFINDTFTAKAKPQILWTENTLKNLPRIEKDEGIWSLHEHLYGDKERAVVVVGASPSLMGAIPELKKLDRKRFCIVVVNSALKVLLKNKIKPDFVIAMDGSPRSIIGDLDCDNKDLTLLCSNNVCPEIFKVWKGKSIWIPYYSIRRNLRPQLRKRLGKTIPFGGNTFSSAMSIAYLVFGAKIFVLVGSELCYDEQYYAHQKSKWEDADATHFQVKDVKGRQRYTNIPLFQYKMWIEKMMTELQDECHFYDTSFGLLGTDCQTVHVMPLKDTINEITNAFDVSKKSASDWRIREKLRYDAAYTTAKYIPENAKKVYEDLMASIIKEGYKRVLDVGCGIGQGVAMMRNAGIEAYGIDISERIKPFWKEGKIDKFCQVACADKIPFPDNHFDLVVCTEVMEHIPEEGIKKVLKEIKRVGSNFFFTIALAEALHKMPHDGSEPHICVKSPAWWKAMFDKLGYRTNVALASSQSSLIIYAEKETQDDRDNLSRYNMFLQPREFVQSDGAFIKV